MEFQMTQVIEDVGESSQSCGSQKSGEKIQVGTLEIGRRRYEIFRGSTTIGRHPACEICLEDITVSKKHAEIEADRRNVFICDLKSSNKTRLNDEVLRPDRFYEVKDGAALKFGIVEGRFYLLRPDDSSFLAPETPEPGLRLRDESLENSVIEATPRPIEDSKFRRPSLPVRKSRQSFPEQCSSQTDVQDLETQVATNPTTLKLAPHRISYEPDRNTNIQDMETQIAGGNLSIHDLETQVQSHVNIQDLETQVSEPADDLRNSGGRVETRNTQNAKPSTSTSRTNIQDLETQFDAGERIQNVETQVSVHKQEVPRSGTRTELRRGTQSYKQSSLGCKSNIQNLETQLNSNEDPPDVETQLSMHETESPHRTTRRELATPSQSSKQVSSTPKINIQDLETQFDVDENLHDAETQLSSKEDEVPRSASGPALRRRTLNAKEQSSPSRTSIQDLETQASVAETSRDASGLRDSPRNSREMRVLVDRSERDTTDRPHQRLSQHQKSLRLLRNEIFSSDTSTTSAANLIIPGSDDEEEIHDLPTQSNLEYSASRKNEGSAKSRSSSPDLAAMSGSFQKSTNHVIIAESDDETDEEGLFQEVKFKDAKNADIKATGDESVCSATTDVSITDKRKKNARVTDKTGDDEENRYNCDKAERPSTKVVDKFKFRGNGIISDSDDDDEQQYESAATNRLKSPNISESVAKSTVAVKVPSRSRRQSDDEDAKISQKTAQKSFESKSNVSKSKTESVNSKNSHQQSESDTDYDEDAEEKENLPNASAKTSLKSSDAAKPLKPVAEDQKSRKTSQQLSESDTDLEEDGPTEKAGTKLSKNDFKNSKSSKSSNSPVNGSSDEFGASGSTTLPPQVLKLLKACKRGSDNETDSDDPYSAPTQVIVPPKLKRSNSKQSSQIRNFSKAAAQQPVDSDDEETDDELTKIDFKRPSKNSGKQNSVPEELEPTQIVKSPKMTSTHRVSDSDDELTDDDLAPTHKIDVSSRPNHSITRDSTPEHLRPTQIVKSPQQVRNFDSDDREADDDLAPAPRMTLRDRPKSSGIRNSVPESKEQSAKDLVALSDDEETDDDLALTEKINIPVRNTRLKTSKSNPGSSADDLAPTQVLDDDQTQKIDVAGNFKASRRQRNFVDDLAPTQVLDDDVTQKIEVPETSRLSRKRRQQPVDDLAPTQVMSGDKTQTQYFDDLMPTQQLNDPQVKKLKLAHLDDSEPTQIIDLRPPKGQQKSKESTIPGEVDDMAPTQIVNAVPQVRLLRTPASSHEKAKNSEAETPLKRPYSQESLSDMTTSTPMSQSFTKRRKFNLSLRHKQNAESKDRSHSDSDKSSPEKSLAISQRTSETLDDSVGKNLANLFGGDEHSEKVATDDTLMTQQLVEILSSTQTPSSESSVSIRRRGRKRAAEVQEKVDAATSPKTTGKGRRRTIAKSVEPQKEEDVVYKAGTSGFADGIVKSQGNVAVPQSPPSKRSKSRKTTRKASPVKVTPETARSVSPRPTSPADSDDLELPKVQIHGTASYPGSPTSSVPPVNSPTAFEKSKPPKKSRASPSTSSKASISPRKLRMYPKLIINRTEPKALKNIPESSDDEDLDYEKLSAMADRYIASSHSEKSPKGRKGTGTKKENSESRPAATKVGTPRNSTASKAESVATTPKGKARSKKTATNVLESPRTPKGRGKGRSKKTSEPIDESTLSNESTLQENGKRKRGRPRKISPSESVVVLEENKKGKKMKKSDSDSSSVGIESQEVQSILEGKENSASSREETTVPKKGEKGLRGEKRGAGSSKSNSEAPVQLQASPSKAARSKSFTTTDHCVLFTGIVDEEGKNSSLIIGLGGSVTDDPLKATVLVTDKIRRTFKFFCAISRSIPIVSINWLKASIKSGHFLETSRYIVHDPEMEAKYRFNLQKSLSRAKAKKLLENHTVLITSHVDKPAIDELKVMVQVSGGKALVRMPRGGLGENSIIVTCDKDRALVRKIVDKGNSGVPVVDVEFLLSGILRQQLEYKEFQFTL